MLKPRVLRFGIQSLDKLIGTINEGGEEVFGIDLSDDDKPPGKGDLPIASSICLTGPDGTGKSLLSLHLVSQYLADCLPESPKQPCSIPKVFHISTDLTYKMALRGWKQFALDCPFTRREPLVELREGRRPRPGMRIQLTQYFPGDTDPDKSIITFLERNAAESSRRTRAEVCFVDLASRTAGDDWGFVHRLLSTLETPGKNDPRHLVVLDAVEGFETLAGDLNAFGEKSSRRSRIAQVMRLAAGKCHLLFVVEEARAERFPEEFVTDVVIRLRNLENNRYSRRTIEIDKGRGQWSIRGQHPYVIRNGKGSTTGTRDNADEPEVSEIERVHPITLAVEKKYQSYVHVFPSLNYLSREIMIDKYHPRDSPRHEKFAGFGITYLDSMLASAGEKIKLDEYSDLRGLPSGTTAALIGDSLTQKSQLGLAFLSRAFYPFAKILTQRIHDAVTQFLPPAGTDQPKQSEEKIKEQVSVISTNLRRARLEKGHPVTVMFTTQAINNEKLANDFHGWLATSIEGLDSSYAEARKLVFQTELQQHIRNQTICRRFEIHDAPSPILMHIFQRNIEKAQRILCRLTAKDRLPIQSERFENSWRIRVVIDDLNGFRNMFPEMRDDPLMLPSLLFMLRREGVTSLIIDTQTSGSPELSITERFDSSVRELVQYRLYTWRLPFYGENRVAISLIPPISQESPGVIRELRWETRAEALKDRSVRVDPHFELYMGLEEGKPQPVPLEVRLYAETPNFKRYIETEEKFLREMFTPVKPPALQETPRIINWTEATDYDTLRDSSRLQRDTRLDHTLLLQVDEFWGLRRATQRRAGAFRKQWSYLNAMTAEITDQNNLNSETVEDPFWVFQPPRWSKEDTEGPEQPSSKTSPKRNQDRTKGDHKYRLDYFDPDCGYKFSEMKSKDKERNGERSDAEQYIDRVPFTWDFGFLLCNGKAWEEAAEVRIGKQDFRVSDFKDARGLIRKLNEPKNPLSHYLCRRLAAGTRLKLKGSADTALLQQIASKFNSLIKGECLYQEARFKGIALSAETAELLARNPSEKEQSARLNRMLLEDWCPDKIIKRTVGGVWEQLRKVNQKDGRTRPTIGWREFLAASKVVAEFQGYRTSTPAAAFDFTMLSPEAFSCLILEMWLSESYLTLSRGPLPNARARKERRTTREQIVYRLSQRRWSWDSTQKELTHRTLLEALKVEKSLGAGGTLSAVLSGRIRTGKVYGFSLELYKVWLLLIEALSFSELVDNASHLNFEFKSRDVGHHAVSARHWYKTASKFIDSLTPEQLEYNWVPVRLPGHFSVRSDWFLAVAGGSRSSRLADNALDLLSSQRANVTRLQEGIGLPTRKLFAPNRESRLCTRLISIREKGKPLANVEYEELRNIGARTTREKQDSEEFYWLWRSGIWAYNRYSRIWHKWLNRTLLQWRSWRERYGSNWKTGFEIYDLLTEIEFGDSKLADERLKEFEALNLDSWNEFHKLRDILIAELEQVSILTS